MTVGGEDDDPKKRHNKRQSGRKAEKKKLKKARRPEEGNEEGEIADGDRGDDGEKKEKFAPDPTRNPKAFAFNNVKKLEKKISADGRH